MKIVYSDGAMVYCENRNGYTGIADKAEVADSSINFFYGYVTLKYDVQNVTFDDDMEIVLLKNDGTEIPTRITSSSYRYNADGTGSECFYFEYREEYTDPIVAADLATLEAVRINDTILPLK